MNSKSTPLTAAERRAALARLDATKDEEIDLTDPDAPERSAEKWAMGRPFHEVYRPKKRAVAMRLDVDLLLWLQSQEGPYQTRINNLLRKAMEESGSGPTR